MFMRFVYTLVVGALGIALERSVLRPKTSTRVLKDQFFNRVMTYLSLDAVGPNERQLVIKLYQEIMDKAQNDKNHYKEVSDLETILVSKGI